MKKRAYILLFIFSISSLVEGQKYIDQIIMKSGDTISCKITLINDMNIFYTYRKWKSEKDGYILLKDVINYKWESKDLKAQIHPENTNYLYDSNDKWKSGMKLIQHFNYPILQTSLTLSIYKKNHDIYIGPEYTKLMEKSLGDPNDDWQQEYWGLNFGYRYIINSTWKRTNIFLQLDFSILETKYKEYQLGPPFVTNDKKIIVENTGGIGLNYKFSDRIEIFGGIGIGSTNGFFLIIDKFNLDSFFGVEYKFK